MSQLIFMWNGMEKTSLNTTSRYCRASEKRQDFPKEKNTNLTVFLSLQDLGSSTEFS